MSTLEARAMLKDSVWRSVVAGLTVLRSPVLMLYSTLAGLPFSSMRLLATGFRSDRQCPPLMLILL